MSEWKYLPTHWAGGSPSITVDGEPTVSIESDDLGEICRLVPIRKRVTPEVMNRAKKIVTCVNACAGIPDPAEAIRKAREAMKAVEIRLRVMSNPAFCEMGQQLRQALAALGGEENK